MENLYTPLSLLIDPFVINRTESVAPSSIAMITNREDFKRYLDWRGQRGEGEEGRVTSGHRQRREN